MNVHSNPTKASSCTICDGAGYTEDPSVMTRLREPTLRECECSALRAIACAMPPQVRMARVSERHMPLYHQSHLPSWTDPLGLAAQSDGAARPCTCRGGHHLAARRHGEVRHGRREPFEIPVRTDVCIARAPRPGEGRPRPSRAPSWA